VSKYLKPNNKTLKDKIKLSTILESHFDKPK